MVMEDGVSTRFVCTRKERKKERKKVFRRIGHGTLGLGLVDGRIDYGQNRGVTHQFDRWAFVHVTYMHCMEELK